MLALVLGSSLAAGCGTTIRPGERGIKYVALRDGSLETKVRPEGFYWQWPWNDIIKYDVTLQASTEPVEVLTAEALHINTKVTVTYHADPAGLYRLQTEIGQNYYADVIRPAFVTIVRSEFAGHNHNDLAKHSPLIEAAALAKLRSVVAGKPIMIERIAIDHIEFDARVSQSISDKMAMEQANERKAFELKIADRDADIARTRARGESDAVRIRAEGEARAITLEGDAQAQAQGAITKTLTTAYLQYKAFDNPATRYYFVPTGKNGIPIIVNTEGAGTGTGASNRKAGKARSFSSIAP
jgi:regulator of protease activity HflC (stomatin/prohibitin superfamily)